MFLKHLVLPNIKNRPDRLISLTLGNPWQAWDVDKSFCVTQYLILTYLKVWIVISTGNSIVNEKNLLPISKFKDNLLSEVEDDKLNEIMISKADTKNFW